MTFVSARRDSAWVLLVLLTDDGTDDPHGLSEWWREQLAATPAAPVSASRD